MNTRPGHKGFIKGAKPWNAGRRSDPRKRFLARAEQRAIDACWPFASTKARPYFTLDGQEMPAARAAYILFVGPVKEREHVHHNCDNPRCVNWIRHLEKASPKRHFLDLTPTNLMAKFKRQTHCKRGHPYTKENTRRKGRGRYCRTCDRLRARSQKCRSQNK